LTSVRNIFSVHTLALLIAAIAWNLLACSEAFSEDVKTAAGGDTTQFICPENISTYTDINECSALIGSNLNVLFLAGEFKKLSWEISGATLDESPKTGIDNLNSYSFNEGTSVVTYTGTDHQNRIFTCSFTVLVSDNQVPRLEQSPQDITVSASQSDCAAFIEWDAPLVIDNCTPSNQMLVNSSHQSGSLFPVGITEVSYEINDGLDYNSIEFSFLVTVVDNEFPELYAPANLSVKCGEAVPDAYTNWRQFKRAGGTVFDNCKIDYRSFKYVSQTRDNTSCPLTITRTYSIADENVNVREVAHYLFVESEVIENEIQEPVVLKSGTGTAASVTYSKTEVSCFGGNDGSADLTISGVSGTLSITWSASNGGSGYVQGNEDQNTLTAGDYSVDVTDDNGTQTINFSGTEPAILNATMNSAMISCNGANDGSITVSSPTGGYGTYEYRINSGSWQASGNFTNLSPNTYSVEIRDAANTSCTVTLGNENITEPAILNATVNSVMITCNGANDGTITVSSPTGGYGTYEYRINSGSWQASGNFINLSPNTYSVEIRDAANTSCTVSFGNENITEPAVLNATVNSAMITCNGANDGTISVSSPTGGYGTYEYRINSKQQVR